MTPERILASLDNGLMRVQGAERTPAERQRYAVFISGKPLGSIPAPSIVSRCTPPAAPFSDAPRSAWNGWSGTASNDRFQPQPGAGLTAADVPKLKLKWAFGFAGDTSAAIQPTIVDGRVFVGSASGRVFALSLADGCAYWMFDADTQVRTAVTVARERGRRRQRCSSPTWPPTSTASTRRPGASLEEEGRRSSVGARDRDAAAARRASVSCRSPHSKSLPAPIRSTRAARSAAASPRSRPATGNQIWKTHTIGETPRPTTRNKAGTQMFGPSGAAVWTAPTLDAARKIIYIGTGDGYSDPAAPTTDAIMALDIDSGAIKWVSQLTCGDAWNLACGGLDTSNCPATSGPDFRLRLAADARHAPVGRAPARRRPEVRRRSWSRRRQRARAVEHAARQGWRARWGRMGVGDRRTACLRRHLRSGVHIPDGGRDGRLAKPCSTPALAVACLRCVERWRKVWSAPPPVCGDRPMCSPAQSAAITAIPGGCSRARSTDTCAPMRAGDGRVIWDFDTARDFETVNKVKASGGSIDVGGPAVAEGVVLTTSGYPTFGGRSGNVLLAFSVDGK